MFIYDFIGRKISIENGKGIVKIYTEKETGVIIDKAIKPRFSNEKYFEEFCNGVNQMAEKVLTK